MNSGARMVRALTMCAFALSTLQYCIIAPDESVRAIPVFVFCFAAFVYFVTASSSERGAAIGSVCDFPILIFTLLVAVMPIMSTIFGSSDTRATMYGVLLVAVLVSARVLVFALGLSGILQSLYVALAISIPLIVLMSFDQFVASIGSSVRYAPFGFHPNLIGRFAAVLVPLHIWIGPPGALWRVFRWSSVLLCIAVVIATSSRASLVVLVTSCFAAVVLRWLEGTGRHFKRSYVIIFLLLGAVSVIFLAFDTSATASVINYLWDKLAIGSPERGLNSGMTGRSKQWGPFLHLIIRTFSFFGNGYRTADKSGYSSDSGLFSLAYEIGVIPLCVIVGRYVWNIARAVRLYLRRGSTQKMCLLMYICLICAFLLNATVERSLFDYGNPFSLLALCFLIAADFDFRSFSASPPRQLSFGALRGGGPPTVRSS